MTDEEFLKIYLNKVEEMIKTHPKLKKQVEFHKNCFGDAVPPTNTNKKMIEKETTYKLTLTDIQAVKLLHLLMNNCDGELWDNDLESIYYEMKDGVDTERFNLYMETNE